MLKKLIMAEQYTITNISGGTSPFTVYLCDENGLNCIYIDNITSGQIPYSFVSPYLYEILPNKTIKVIDSQSCQVTSSE